MLEQYLTALCDLYGPAGHERPVMDYLTAAWSSYGDTTITPVGNLLCRVGGSGPRVLIQAHADEIGLLTKAVDEHGFLRFGPGTTGSENDRPPSFSYPGQRMMVLADAGPIPGTIGMAFHHVRSAEQAKKATLDWRDLFCDIGVRSREQALDLGVRPGTPIVFSSRTDCRRGFVIGKALDDRAGLAIMTELLFGLDREKLSCELFLGATIQEEIGLAGAADMVAGRGFDCAIALDIGLSGDIPTVEDTHVPCRLGAGPILVHKDAMVHYHEPLTAHLATVAADAGIPVQHAVFGAYASDGREFIVGGVPTSLVAFATRYTHSPWETASIDDLLATTALLSRLVTGHPWHP